MQSIALSAALAAGTLVSLCATARAQVVNPADKQKPPPKELPGLTDKPPQRLRTYELPPSVVEAERLSPLREEDRIGSYGQPRWTASRRFPSTRVYVIPEGKIEAAYWTRVKSPRHGPSTVETQYELELGLPHRLQLDLYLVNQKTGQHGELDTAEQKVEVRYALADWGEIWGNPTVYEEYVSVDQGSDVVESKLLLGDELAVGWHWGTNLVWEREISNERTNVFELTGGLSHTLSDEKFSLGAEAKVELEDVESDRGDYTKTLEVGPSLQWRPLPGVHVDLAPLFGIGHDSRRSDVYFVIGVEL